MKTKIVATDSLIPYIRNPRKNSAAVDKVAASIKEYGWQQPIVVDKENVIIAGHTRLLAAQKLGMDKVPVHVADLSDAQAKAYRLADNRISEDANWDIDLLGLEIRELDDLGFDLDLTGFDNTELANLLIDPDLGETDEDMVFTDPPYNVDYSNRGSNNLGTIKNDSMSDGDFDAFLRDVFASYVASMKPLASIYVCHPDSQSAPKIGFERAFADCFTKSSTIIWVKQSAAMGWQDYRCQHEPILYGWKAGRGKHQFYGDRTKTTVWHVRRDAQAGYVHPTQKPVALVEEALVNSSKGSDLVLDLFGGSGSTLIACQKNGRKARLMELDPKYCDVIVKRWEQYTSEQATLRQREAA